MKLARELSISYTIAKGDDLADAYGVNKTGIPAMYVIGQDGRVLDFFIGYNGKQTEEKLLSVLENALKRAK